MPKTLSGLPGFENLRLNDLLPASRFDLQQVTSSGDEELFRAAAKMVVKLQDVGGTDPFWVAEELGSEYPSLVASRPAIERLAELILASEIPGVSSSFQVLFDDFNQTYFSGALDRYQVHVVFDLHIFADEPIPFGDDPIYGGFVSSGLIRFNERRIYIRYTDIEAMQEMLIHEMAHAATSGEHDEVWLNEMIRLHRAGAPVPEWELMP